MAGQGKQTSAERRKQKAAEARAAAAVASRKRRLKAAGWVGILALLGGAVFGGVVLLTGDDDSDTAEQEPAATPTAEPTVDQTGVAAGKKRCLYLENAGGTTAKDVGRPEELADAKGTVKVTMTMNKKPVVLELDRAAAPCTVNSFVHLATNEYYDKTPCHRLLDDAQAGLTYAVLQCGDPTGTGSGGPGYKFADENLSGAKYSKGVIAMANSGPNTNGSQFFMMFKDSDFSPDYIPFGKVLSGLDVLTDIAKGGKTTNSTTGAEDVPKTKTTIEKVTVEGVKSTARPTAKATDKPSETPSSTAKPTEEPTSTTKP